MGKTIERGAVVLLVGAALAVGCESTGWRLPMAEELVAPGTADEAEAEVLRRGRALMVTRCADCHRLYWPGQYTPEVWAMFLRQHSQRVSLAKENLAAIEAYIVAASRAARTMASPSRDAGQP